MGVMPCSREGCENILCSRYNSKYGYICTECFEELVSSRTVDIAAFMNTGSPDEPPLPEEWYEEIFPIG